MSRSPAKESSPPSPTKRRRLPYATLTLAWAGCLTASAALQPESVLAVVLVPSVFTTITAIAVAGLARVKERRAVLLALGLTWMAVLWGNLFIGTGIVRLGVTLTGITFFSYVANLMLRDFLGPGTVTADTLWGAIGVFILVGVTFALVFMSIEILAPGSFEGAQFEDGSFIYFSFVTLTTLGYGDIVPVTGLARMTCAFAAMFGMMYSAVVVARLVALAMRESEAG